MSFISFHYEEKSLDALVVEVKDNYYIVNNKLERLYIYEKGHRKEVGDIIHYEGQKKAISFYKLESGFDFEDYLNKKGITHQLEVKKEKVVFSNPLRFKAYQDRFLDHFDPDTRGMLASILFSRNEEFDGKDNLDSLHINRLINASGIYYGLYLSFFTFIFSFFFKKKWAKLIGIVCLFPYVISMITKFSLLRFFAFTIFRYLNEYVLKKKLAFIDYFSYLGIGFIIIDYHFVYLDSFVLGFSIPFIVQLISHSFKTRHFIKKKALVYALILLFFIPFDIRYHHEIYPLSYSLQILLTPIFMVFGLNGIIASYGLPIYSSISFLATLIGYFSSFLIKLKFAIHLPAMNEYIAFIYYGLYFVSCYYVSISFRPIYKWLTLFISCFSLTYIMPIKNAITDRVTFINVGQGDCCLITHQFTSVLIDTGGSIYTDIGKDCLIPYFKSQRIYNIDLVITTHDDYDHMGALASLKENFTVKNYIKEAEMFPIDIGGLHFTNYNTFTALHKEENDSSLVIGFRLFNTDFLITGDAPIAVEKEIIKTYKDVPCDILKVGHHGSDTSTCDEFVKFLSPKEAVISVGRNKYGHPSKKVINTLTNNHVRIRSTLEEGSISYTSYSFAL